MMPSAAPASPAWTLLAGPADGARRDVCPVIRLLTTAARVLYLFAPLVVAAALSGLVLRYDLLPALRRPIDAGRTFRGRRWFGDNKTWRGVLVAIVGCVATVSAQKFLFARVAAGLALVPYQAMTLAELALFGSALGGGATLGELPNSFVKRQLGILPGQPARGALSALFYVWDQIDLLAAWPLIAFWVRPTPPLVALSVLLVLAIHPLISLIGFVIGARRSAR